MDNLLYKDETYKIIGCCMEVYNILGNGFLEEVYQEALVRELTEAGIPFRREVPLKISYKGVILEKRYFADFVCCDKIIVELKAVTQVNSAHMSQLINYLAATGFQFGLLVNFGNAEKLEWYRRIRTVEAERESAREKPFAQISSIGEDSRSETSSSHS